MSTYTDGYRDGYRDGFRDAQDMKVQQATVPASEPVTELPDLGEGMPSDADMLLYATPFFQTEDEKKENAAKDDAAENEK
jgi:hypothetical protein